jgi:hypothetical protein
LVDSTVDKVEFDTEDFNNGMTTDVATNYRITARRGGVYHVVGEVYISDTDANDGVRSLVRINVNGSTKSSASGGQMSGNAIDDQGHEIFDIIELAADDYVEIFFFHSGAAADMDTSTNANLPSYFAISEQL